MELLVTVAVLVALAAVVVARRRRMHRAGTVEVTADGDGVRRVLADGRREEITWPEVREVDVFVTRVGPHRRSGGAVVLYGDHERGCIVPLDRLGASGLLEHVHHLPGFDPATVVAAVDEGRPAPGAAAILAPRPVARTTVCWRRPEA